MIARIVPHPCRLILAASVLVVPLVGCAKSGPHGPENPGSQDTSLEKMVATLKESRDPAELESSAIALAKLNDSKSLAPLLALLGDPDFWLCPGAFAGRALMELAFSAIASTI